MSEGSQPEYMAGKYPECMSESNQMNHKYINKNQEVVQWILLH